MKILFCLLDADYAMDNTVRLLGVDEKGKSVAVLAPYEPYFYVLPRNANTIKSLEKNEMVKRVESVKRTLGRSGMTFLKAYADEPQNVPKIRDAVKKDAEGCYEYNINFYKRYMIDKCFYPLDWLEIEGEPVKLGSFKTSVMAKGIKKSELTDTPDLRLLAFDIEVIDGKIIMISAADASNSAVLSYKEGKGITLCKDEKDMLKKFEKLINEKDPDVIFGFNSDMFDFDIISKKLESYKIDIKISRDGSGLRFAKRGRASAARIKGRPHIDISGFVRNIVSPQLQTETLSLNDVAQEIIGEGKKELSMEEMLILWNKNDISRIASYCLRDSELTLKLGRHVLPLLISLSRASGQLPFDCSRMSYGTLVEWLLMRKAVEKGIIVPNQPHWGEIQKRRERPQYTGGYVKEPKAGLHDNIAVFDFRSLYPSIIVTFNISPETLNCSCCKTGGHKVPGSKNYFCKKTRGFVPSVIEDLIKKRRKEKQLALKILANASYGMLAYAGARWYCYECATSAAAFGRDCINKAIKSSEAAGFDVLYADTDSLFVTARGIDKKAALFLKNVNKTLPGMLELGLQGVYKKGLFVPQRIGSYTAKKRYALLGRDGSMLVRGMEAVRRDWCDLAKRLQHDVLRLVLEEKEEDAVKKVREAVKKVRSRSVELKDISIRTQLGKPLAEYKSVGPHVAVAQKLRKQGHDVEEGMVLSYVITKGPGTISARAEPSDKVKLADYDIDYYINNQVISVALRVLKVLGYNEKDLLGNDLEKFVKR